MGTCLVFHENCTHPFLNIGLKIIIIILSFFLRSFGEKRFVNLVKVFSCQHKINKFNTKISAHYCIICLYSKNICFYVFIVNKCFNLFWNMFYTKTIKISNIIIKIKSNPISSNIRVLILVYYISLILYFSEIISRINTIKSRLTLIFLYFKTS